MKCILCKNNRFVLIAKRLRNDTKTKVKKCLKCGLSQLSPVPTDKQIEKTYNTTSISIPKNNKDKLNFKEKFSLKDTIFNFNLVSPLLKKGSKILDYGCGYGFFLKKMAENGFKTYGLDLSRIRIETAKKISPKSHISNQIKDFYGEKFDCVTAFHVLEHTTDPVSFIKTLGNEIKKDGIIVIGIPTLEDNMLNLSKEYKDFYWKKEHISYFNEKTLRLCIKKSELNIAKIGFVQRWDIFNFMNWIIRKSPQPKEEIIKNIKDKDLTWLNNYYKKYLEKNKKADAMYLILNKK